MLESVRPRLDTPRLENLVLALKLLWSDSGILEALWRTNYTRNRYCSFS